MSYAMILTNVDGFTMTRSEPKIMDSTMDDSYLIPGEMLIKQLHSKYGTAMTSL